MKVAVIGSTGYVGAAVVKELAARGHEVTAFARKLLAVLQPRRDVNWAMVSPPARLGANAGYSEERTGRYRLGGDDLLMDGDAPAGISVADLAIAIADDAEKKGHLHRRFTVAAQ